MAATDFIPKHNKLYRFRYGHKGGEQICLFVGYRGDGYLVRKWQANSTGWTARVAIAGRDLLGPASQDDCRKVAVDVTKL